MSKQENDLHNFIKETKKEFLKLPAEAVSFPRSCNNMKKYYSSSDVFIKVQPIHVKGALIYNHQIKQFGLEKKISVDTRSDKIKFVKLLEANPFKFDVISYVTELPKEFKLKDYVDYELQFEKTLLILLDLFYNL